MPQKPQKASLGQIRTDLSANRIGDIAEQYVQMIATYKGAEVFPNRNCTGKVDLVLKIDDQLVEIDVKIAQWGQNGRGSWRWVPKNVWQVKPPVYPVIVIPEGDIMNWQIRWKYNNGHNQGICCPPGLEDFWKKPPELKNEPTN